MMFDFQCVTCGATVTIRGPIGRIPKTPTHCSHKTKRVWASPMFSITGSFSDYMNMAYEGSETVPGLSVQEVRHTVDTQGKVRS